MIQQQIKKRSKKFVGALPTGDYEGTAAVIAKMTDTPAPVPTLNAGLQYRGFNKGLSQILHVDYAEVIAELRQALQINSRSGLSHYRNGRGNLRATQAAAVEEVFRRRGITDIWDA
jgi:hypothetical protein